MHETRQGRLVAALQHHFPSEVAMDWHDAWLHDDVPAIWEAILDHDPIVAVRLGSVAAVTPYRLPLQDHARCAEMVRIASFRAAWFGLVGAVFGWKA